MIEKKIVTKFDSEKAKLTVPQTVLIIGAHPDDIEINAGGLTAILAECGSQIHWLICTDGGCGSWENNIAREQLIETRRVEQLNAADILGVTKVHFLNFSDGYLSFKQQELMVNLVQTVRSIKPRMIATHDPWKPYDLNEDHRVVGYTVSHAIIMASNYTFLPESKPHFTKIVGYFNTIQPNLWLDIYDFYKKKEQAILAHDSQFGNRNSFIKDLKDKAILLGNNFQMKMAETHHIEINQ